MSERPLSGTAPRHTRSRVLRLLALAVSAAFTAYAVARAVRRRRFRRRQPPPSAAERTEQTGPATPPGAHGHTTDPTRPTARGHAADPTRSTAAPAPGIRRRVADALRLVALLASFALTAYAAVRLLDARLVDTAYWFVGSAVLHDLVLFPTYAIADASLVLVLRRWPALAGPRGLPWINHLRFPVAISAVLLLMSAPLVFRLPGNYEGITTYTTDPYLERWALVTATLFALSALAYALRLALATQRSRSPARSEIQTPSVPPTRARSPGHIGG